MIDLCEVKIRFVPRLDRDGWTRDISDLHRAAFADRGGVSGSSELFEVEWQRTLHSDAYRLAVAEHGTSLLAYAVLRQESTHSLFGKRVHLRPPFQPDWVAGALLLVWLGVDPAERRQGIGGALLQAIMGLTRHGALYVDNDNHGAQAFYSQHGWCLAGRNGAQQVWCFDHRSEEVAQEPQSYV